MSVFIGIGFVCFKNAIVMGKIFVLFLLILHFVCERLSAQVMQGRCSYYAKSFQGRPLACGGKFDTAEYTAAHRLLPCGTIIKVKNLANGKWILLRVSDRGPYSKTLVLDVSRTAAKHLDMLKSGVIRAQIEVIALPQNSKMPDFTPAQGED